MVAKIQDPKVALVHQMPFTTDQSGLAATVEKVGARNLLLGAVQKVIERLQIGNSITRRLSWSDVNYMYMAAVEKVSHDPEGSCDTNGHPLTKADRFCRKFGNFFHHYLTLCVECFIRNYVSRVQKHSLPPKNVIDMLKIKVRLYTQYPLGA